MQITREHPGWFREPTRVLARKWRKNVNFDHNARGVRKNRGGVHYLRNMRNMRNMHNMRNNCAICVICVTCVTCVTCVICVICVICINDVICIMTLLT